MAEKSEEVRTIIYSQEMDILNKFWGVNKSLVVRK